MQGFGAMADQRRGQLTRYHLQAARPHNAMRACQLLQKFIVIQPPHPHAVFQLGKILVKIARRQFTPGLQIPFIPRIHQPCSQLFPAFFPVFFQNIQRFGGAFPVIHGQLIQALAIVGQARRHRRNAADMLGQRQQIVQSAAQLRAVVHAAANHQLAVHFNARRSQILQLLQNLARLFVGQHPHPQLGVGGVYRNIDGADVHGFDALHLTLTHVGEGDIVAV